MSIPPKDDVFLRTVVSFDEPHDGLIHGRRSSELSMAEVLNDVVSTLARHHMRFPSNFMLLVKAIMTIEGVGRALDPSFQIVEYAAPFVEALIEQEYTPGVLAARTAEAVHAC